MSIHAGLYTQSIPTVVINAFKVNGHLFTEPSTQDVGIISDAIGTLLNNKPVNFDTKGWEIVEVEDYWHNSKTRREFKISAPKERASRMGISETGISILKKGLEPNIVIQFV